MADKNLEIALRIKADAKQATAEVANFTQEVSDVGTAASTASTAATQLSNSVDSTGKKFVYAGQSVFSLRDAIQQSDGAAKQLINTTTTVAAETEKAAQKFVYAGKSTFSLRDGLKAVTVSSKDQASELARLLSVYDGASAYTQRLARDEAMLKKAMDEGRISATQYQRSIVELQRRNQQLASSYGTLRGQMSNVGFQFQDIAVQMQMGVNPAVILSQQGSQLVSAFNPLAGAVIAIGGAIIGAMLPAFFNAGKATEELATQIDDLNESYVTLTESQRQFKRDQEQSRQDEIREDMEKTREEIEKLTRRYNELAAAQKGASAPTGGGSTMGLGFGPGVGAIQGADEKAAKALTQARAELDTKNQQLAESEKELGRISGEKIVDEKELIKKANELIESLEKETSAYGLVGEALGEYVATQLKADQIDATGATRARIVELYRLRDAQKEATQAEREAEAEAEKVASKAKARQEAAVEYVRNLQRQAAALDMTAQEVADAENAHRGLTGQLLKEAQAAQLALQADKDRIAIAELNIQLLRAQGREQEATQLEFEKRYGDMLKRLEAAGDTAGAEIIKNIIDLKKLDAQLAEAEKSFQNSLENMARQETSINTQREAGLISEYEARQKILELHRATHAELEAQRPVLEDLAKQPGAVGEAASAALAQLNAQGEQLLATTTLLEQTLKTSLESGLTDAILGLADGTKSFGDAIKSVGASVAQALAEMAAQALAQQAVAALFGAAGGGGFASLFGFSEGGYTGEGGKYQVAGVVHRGEGVLSQKDISALGGPAGFHALRNALSNGYADGGLVGMPAPAMPSTLGNATLPEPASAFSATVPLTQNITMIDDPARIAQALNTPAGEENLVIVMRKDPSKFRAILGM